MKTLYNTDSCKRTFCYSNQTDEDIEEYEEYEESLYEYIIQGTENNLIDLK